MIAKATILQVFSYEDPTYHLAKNMTQMRIKEAQLNKVQVELRQKGDEVKTLNEELARRDVVISNLNQSKASL